MASIEIEKLLFKCADRYTSYDEIKLFMKAYGIPEKNYDNLVKFIVDKIGGNHDTASNRVVGVCFNYDAVSDTFIKSLVPMKWEPLVITDKKS